MSAAEKCIELADALRGLLEPSIVDAGGTIDRDYVPRYPLQSLERAIKATVIPRTIETSRRTRSDWQYDLAVDTALQKRTKTRVDNDRLVRFAGTLADILQDEENTHPVDGVALLLVQIDPVFSPEHLDQKNVFTCVLRATYRRIA